MLQHLRQFERSFRCWLPSGGRLLGGRLLGVLLLWLLAGCGAGTTGSQSDVHCPHGLPAAVCDPARIQADLDEALAWYRQQAQQIEQQAAYPPTMVAQLGSYYSGDLLFRARETLAANAPAGRVVAATWEQHTPLDTARWDDDAGVAWITIRVQGYRRIVLPAEQSAPGLPLARGITQNWRFGMVYDAAAQRWKIAYASRIGD